MSTPTFPHTPATQALVQLCTKVTGMCVICLSGLLVLPGGIFSCFKGALKPLSDGALKLLYFSRKENLLKGRGVCATLHSMFLPLKCPFRERRSPASFSTKAVKLWRTDLGMGFPSIDWGHCTKERLSSPIRILTDDPSLLPHASQA